MNNKVDFETVFNLEKLDDKSFSKLENFLGL